MKQLKDIDFPLSPEEQARLNAAAKAWLQRKDPSAQELAGKDDAATEKQKADAEAFTRMVLERNAEAIRRQWLAAGLEPRPYSLSLARNLNMEMTDADGADMQSRAMGNAGAEY